MRRTHVGATWPLTNDAHKIQKDITPNPELGFEHGNSGLKAIDEQKVMEISRRGFKMIKESGILMPHP
jgi:hypothetical protein